MTTQRTQIDVDVDISFMHVSPPLPHTLFPAVPPRMLPAKQTPKHGGAESVRGRRSRPPRYGKFLIKISHTHSHVRVVVRNVVPRDGRGPCDDAEAVTGRQPGPRYVVCF